LGADSLQTRISEISSQVDELRVHGEEYIGPHFIQMYRTLSERCLQFQMKLDKIDLDGRDDVKTERKAILIRIETLLIDLSAKVHPDGKPCPDCELKQL